MRRASWSSEELDAEIGCDTGRAMTAFGLVFLVALAVAVWWAVKS